ncbi:hypothetical protein [Streptomyces microflavus]
MRLGIVVVEDTGQEQHPQRTTHTRIVVEATHPPAEMAASFEQQPV